jgi:hypothetical protein
MLRPAGLVGEHPPRFLDPQTQYPLDFVRRRISRKTGILRGDPVYRIKGMPGLSGATMSSPVWRQLAHFY